MITKYDIRLLSNWKCADRSVLLKSFIAGDKCLIVSTKADIQKNRWTDRPKTIDFADVC